MKKSLNPHNKFNKNNNILRRWKYAIAKRIQDKIHPEDLLIPLLSDGTIAHVYDKNIKANDYLIKLWFFKYGFDIGVKTNNKIFHIEPKHKENEACNYSSTGFRLYEVKNEN